MKTFSLHETLLDLGLSKNESKVYEALLKLKKARPARIAEESHLSRGTAYHVLEYLNAKELVLKIRENDTLVFAVKRPDEGLERFVQRQLKEAQSRQELFKNSIGLISPLYLSGNGQLKLQYYEGEKGFWDFFMKTLEVKNLPMIGYAANPPFQYDIRRPSFPKHYAKVRFQRKAHGRYFTLPKYADEGKKYLSMFYGKYLKKIPDLVRIKVLPKAPQASVLQETVIFDNRYAISNGYDPKHFLGVIIEDENIANTQRIIFESLWKMVKEEIRI